jgi:hypothetical protein
LNKLLYTASFGNYDTIKPINQLGFDCVIFTDNKELSVKGWRTVYIESNGNPRKQSRLIKICPVLFIDNIDLYVYIDGNYEVIGNLNEYISLYFTKGFMTHQHGQRNCIFKEADQILKLGKESRDVLEIQMNDYLLARHKYNDGLYQNGFLVFDNSAKELCTNWYNEVEKYSYRDQLSLPFVVKKYNYRINVMTAHRMKTVLKLNPHKDKEITDDFKVWYFNPGRGDKNLGKAYNEHCEIVPSDDDWICMTDGDIMHLVPYWSKQIESIIKKHSKDYALISCVTNRLGLEWQLPKGFSDDPNVLTHHAIAEELYKDKYDEVILSRKPTAGLMMLFPKSTWNKVHFTEGLTGGGKFIDWRFSEAVQRIGNIGIATGLYVFHFYRFNKDKRDIKHLL